MMILNGREKQKSIPVMRDAFLLRVKLLLIPFDQRGFQNSYIF